jgi:hypothetical protein
MYVHITLPEGLPFTNKLDTRLIIYRPNAALRLSANINHPENLLKIETFGMHRNARIIGKSDVVAAAS